MVMAIFGVLRETFVYFLCFSRFFYTKQGHSTLAHFMWKARLMALKRNMADTGKSRQTRTQLPARRHKSQTHPQHVETDTRSYKDETRTP